MRNGSDRPQHPQHPEDTENADEIRIVKNQTAGDDYEVKNVPVVFKKCCF